MTDILRFWSAARAGMTMPLVGSGGGRVASKKK
ncbi:hypothetical protein ACVINI_007639 [Rhizobium beringeri]|jgi:hypothetical protein